MTRSIGTISLICPADLASVVRRIAAASSPLTGSDPHPAIELCAVAANLMASEVSRAARTGGGIVALARVAQEIAGLRAAGADRVIVALSSARQLARLIARAASEADAEARERGQRVEYLSQLIEGVSTGAAKPETLLSAIRHALLERLDDIAAKDCPPRAKSSPYVSPDAMAALRSSVNIIERVHARQAGRCAGLRSDVAEITRHVAPMVRAAFGADIRVPVVARGGPFLVALPDWCVAVVLLSIGVALASTPAFERDKTELVGKDSVVPGSAPCHFLDDPLPGPGVVAIDVVGLPDLVTLEIATDIADPRALPEGMISPDAQDSRNDPASVALGLAAQILKPSDGMLYIDSGFGGGSIVTIFVPAAESSLPTEP